MRDGKTKNHFTIRASHRLCPAALGAGVGLLRGRYICKVFGVPCRNCQVTLGGQVQPMHTTSSKSPTSETLYYPLENGLICLQHCKTETKSHYWHISDLVSFLVFAFLGFPIFLPPFPPSLPPFPLLSSFPPLLPSFNFLSPSFLPFSPFLPSPSSLPSSFPLSRLLRSHHAVQSTALSVGDTSHLKTRVLHVHTSQRDRRNPCSLCLTNPGEGSQRL